jgi:hypothetical protein
MADEGKPIITLVCEACGQDYFFEETPPDHLICSRCGGEVFRQFDAVEGSADEAVDDFRASTEREVGLGEATPGTTATDLLDLEHL